MDKKIKKYAAPMEGLTGFAWRKAHSEVFGGTDKYFSPFVVANQTHKFKTKEIRDLTQEEENLVPQVMTDKAEHFIWAAGELKAMGYSEINLNIGCPSGTVVTRGKGCGMLKDPEKLDHFLEDIFSAVSDMNISLKTRVGFADKNEWDVLLEIYNKYPASELIIHPRIREEYYEGYADRDLFSQALKMSGLNLVYNGDINRPDDEAFSYGVDVMAGRGLIGDPALFRQAAGGAEASIDELKAFHELLLEYYGSYMDGDGPVIHHMKAMWIYMAQLFEYDERDMKKLRKAKNMSDYRTAANLIFMQR